MSIPEWAIALGLGAGGGLVSAAVRTALLIPHFHRDEREKLRLELGFFVSVLVGMTAGGLAWCFSAGADFDSTKISPIRLGEAGGAGLVGWPAIKVYIDRKDLSDLKADATQTIDSMSARLLQQGSSSPREIGEEGDGNNE